MKLCLKINLDSKKFNLLRSNFKVFINHVDRQLAAFVEFLSIAGSPWTPRNPSGKAVLLFSLIFALVIYNAYAGFITSILSVQASGIKSITDILSHNFKLGYSISDDEYIRVSLSRRIKYIKFAK